MKEKYLEDSLEQENYNQIIKMLEDLLLDLFKKMLDYKNISYLNEENNFDYLDALIRTNYPQFSENLIHISVLRNEPGHTHLASIRDILSTYIYLKNMYNNSELEKRYLESNNQEDIVDDYDIVE